MGTARLRLATLIVALVLLAAAASAWALGGWTIDLSGLAFRLRRPWRVAFAGAALLAVWAVWAGRRWGSDARALLGLPWTSPNALGASLALAVGLAGVGYGTFAASGADSYGYLSESRLLIEGRLRVPQELSDAPWPEPLWSLSPLGYRPATVPGAIVPTYPPGLPLLFAGARAAAGPCAPFYVVPAAGALLVWLTYRLGLRLLAPPLALAGAILLAASPPFLFQLMWPMSDVPVAAIWLAALLLTAGTGGRAPLAAGAVASLAILVRPNLAPLAGLCLAALLLSPDAGVGGASPAGSAATRRRRGRAAMFLAGLAPGVAALAALDAHLYGAWWRLGYLGTEPLYSLANVVPNLRRYGSWAIEANTPLILLALAPLVAWPRFLPRSVTWRLLLTGLVAGVWLSYLPYFQFDDWWYLRFLLPAWPALALLTVAALHAILARALPGTRAAGAALIAVLVLGGVTFGRAKSLGAFVLRPVEQRYVDVGRHVATRTPPGSVVLSMQHSGSVRYYSGRTTLRYDLLDAAWLDRAIDYLQARGRRPYILLEDWEVPRFRDRFAGTVAGGLGWNPVAEWRNGKVLLFDATDRLSDKSPERIVPSRNGCVTVD